MTRSGEDLGADITARTDSYFNRTKAIVARYGDKRVTYALFLRRPVIKSPSVGRAGQAQARHRNHCNREDKP